MKIYIPREKRQEVVNKVLIPSAIDALKNGRRPKSSKKGESA